MAHIGEFLATCAGIVPIAPRIGAAPVVVGGQQQDSGIRGRM